jgi:3-oxoacyl-[acyl-carrier protein] reductase
MSTDTSTSTRLAHHIALVTGAAHGIGRAIAERLLQDGARVAFTDLDLATAQALAAAHPERALALHLDVADLDSVDLAFRAVEAAWGPVSLLVNNAGHVHQALFQDIPLAAFDRMVQVHLRGTFVCTQRAIRPMLAQRSGVVVNVASQLGQIGGMELVHYSAAKAGIIGLTKALAREVSAQGVRVNAVAPGPINTDLVRALSPEWRTAKTQALPLGAFGEPEEVAATVAFLASNDARLYVGQTLGPNSGDVML